MKKVRFVFAAALALALASCNKLAVVEQPVPQDIQQEEKISAEEVAYNLELATKAVAEDEETMEKLGLFLQEGKDGDHLYIEVTRGESCYVKGEVGLVKVDGRLVLDLDVLAMGFIPIRGTIDPVQFVKYYVLADLSNDVYDAYRNVAKANENIDILVYEAYTIYLDLELGETDKDFAVKLYMANLEDQESSPICLSDLLAELLKSKLEPSAEEE